MLAYYDKKGRVSKEHKKQIKSALENARWNSKRANGGKHSRYEWEEVKKNQDYTCLYCGKREPDIKLTKDHIVPVSQGGGLTAENTQALCKHCNSRKHAKHIDYRPNRDVGM